MYHCKIFSAIIFYALMIHFGATNGPMKVIIDTDPGSDDAVALLLALSAKEIEVVAITYTYGNTKKAQVETNVLKVLTIANRHDIPVFGGAVKPMIRNSIIDFYFGKDAFGDFNFDQEINIAINRSTHASLAMIDLSKKYSGDLNIITLGPLTNVAIAVQLDSNFTQRIKRFYTMGGQLYEPGEHKNAEFNFATDPESVAILLKSPMKSQILITPYDTVTKNAISKVWREQVLGKLDSTAIKFLNKVERLSLATDNSWQPIDAVAMATMIWPSLITSTTQTHMSVVTCGSLSGVTDINSVPPQGEVENVEIIRNFSVESFKSKLLENFA